MPKHKSPSTPTSSRIGSVLAVMPTRNQASYLFQAIKTVVVGGVDRLVIVNDASTDDTQSIIVGVARDTPAMPIRIESIVLESCVGTAEAINVGIREFGNETSSSIWWTWASSDNWYEPDWASRLVAATDDKTGAIYSAFWKDSVGSGTQSHRRFTDHGPDRLIRKLACYYGPCFLIRSDVWSSVGDHRGAISHDYDHWLRVEEVCRGMGLRIFGIDEALCHYRVHDKRRTVTEGHTFDAYRWQNEALRRRQNSR